MIKEKLTMLKYFVSKIIFGLIGMVSLSMYSRFLTPETNGMYSLIIGLISVISAIFIGWISSSSLRYYNHYEDKSEFFTNVFIDWFIMSIISISIIFVISNVFSYNYIYDNFLYIIFIFLGISLYEIFEKLIRAAYYTNVYVITIISQALVNLGVFYILVNYYELNIEAIFISNIVSHFLLIIVSFIVFRKKISLNIKKSDIKMQLKFLNYGFPMIGIWGISWLLSYSDRYMIAMFIDNYSVGIYDLSYKVVDSIGALVVAAFSLSIFPMLIKKYNEDGITKCKETMNIGMKYFLLTIIPVALGLAAVRDKIYETILSYEYIEGSLVLMYTSFGIVFMGINTLLYKFWQLKEQTKKILKLMLITVTVNIGLNLVFIPMFGMTAAAITTMISYIVGSFIVVLRVKKEFNYQLEYKTILKIISSGIIMYFIVRWCSSIVHGWYGIIILIFIGIIVFGVLLFIFGILKEELKLVSDLFRRRKNEKR